MAYLKDIPLATDQISQSQAQIKGNFGAINTVVDVNHVIFDAPNQGKHKYIELPVATAAPAPVNGKIDIYSALLGAKNELYIQQADATLPIPVTTNIPMTKTETTIGATTNGYAYLPSGILLNWGTGTASDGVDPATQVTFKKPYSITANVFSIQLTLYTNLNVNNFISVEHGTLTNAGFRARSWTRTGGASTSTFYYLVIGI